MRTGQRRVLFHLLSQVNKGRFTQAFFATISRRHGFVAKGLFTLAIELQHKLQFFRQFYCTYIHDFTYLYTYFKYKFQRFALKFRECLNSLHQTCELLPWIHRHESWCFPCSPLSAAAMNTQAGKLLNKIGDLFQSTGLTGIIFSFIVVLFCNATTQSKV